MEKPTKQYIQDIE